MEERKVQLVVGADVSQAVDAMTRVGQATKDMAQTAAQSGQQAAAGLGKVGDGAAASATKVDSAYRAIAASIQRSVAATKAALQGAQKGDATYFEGLIDQRVTDPAQLTKLRAQVEELRQARVELAAMNAVAANDTWAKSVIKQADAIRYTKSELLEMEAAQRGLSAQMAPHIAVVREQEKALKGLGAGAKLTAFQTQQLGYQLHDFGVQVFSGQSILTAFVQQGSQLSGTFGGAGNAFKAVMSVLTPMRLAMIGAAAGVGVLGLAMFDAEKHARALSTVQAQLIGTGRGGMFSTDELEDFTRQLSATPGVTRKVAEEIVSELSKVGGISKDVFVEVAKRAAVFAKATGTDIPTALKTLAQAIADPERGADDLAKKLTDFPSGAQFAAQAAARMGDVAKASREMLKGIDEATKGVKVNGTPLEESADKLRIAWERAEDVFRRGDGLRKRNEQLADMLALITAIVNKMPGLGHDPTGGTLTPGVTPGGTVIDKVIRQAGRFGGDIAEKISGGAGANADMGGKNFGITDTGGFADTTSPASSTSSSSPAAPLDNAAARDLINKQLEVAKGHQSEAQQIEVLKERREGLNRALKESNRLYDEARAKATSDADRAQLDKDHARESGRLSAGVAGVDKEIFGLSKGQGILDAKLQAEFKKAEDALARARDTSAFESKKAQTLFQGGYVSQGDVFDTRLQEIKSSTAAEIAALEAKRIAIQAHLDASPELDKKEQDQKELKQIDLDIAKIDLKGKRDLELANIELGVSTDQLNEKLLNYRSNLAAAAGDEVGAAKLRRQIADQQDRIFAGQAASAGNPISQADLDNAKRLREQQDAITQSKIRTGQIDQQLQIAEDRIALAQNTGAIGEIEALNRQGAAREAILPAMRAELAIREKLSRDRPEDIELKIDVEGFRLQVEKLQAALDPLEQRFNSMFSNAAANLFGDLMNGTFAKVDLGKMEQKLEAVSRDFRRKQDEIRNSNVPEAEKVKAESAAFKERLAAEKSARKDAHTSFFKQLGEAGKSFGTSITKELNGMLAKDFATSLFGKGGAASGVGGFFASIFGAPKAAANTPQQSFRGTEIAAENAAGEADTLTANTTQATAAIKSARALDDLTTAAQSAAVAMSKITGDPLAPLSTTGGPTGNFEGDSTEIFKAIQGIKDPAERANATAAFYEQARRTPNFGQTGTFVLTPQSDEVPITTTGDFARMDRSLPSGEQAVMDQFSKAADSGKKLSAANTQAATAALNLAASTSRAGRALIVLEQITALAGGKSAGASGGGSVPFLSAIFGRGGIGFAGLSSGVQAGFSQTAVGSAGAGTGLAYGNQDYGQYFSDGGYTGHKDPKQVAGIVHGGEYVFSEPTVRAIGLDRLERLHKQAKAGHTELPGYSDGGYVSVPGQRMQWTTRSPQNTAATGDTYVTNHTTHVNVQATPNTSRATALQTGREVGRGIELARRRNG